MVTIGSLTWTAKVEGAGNAQRKADNVADSMEQADEKAGGLNTRLGQTSGRLVTGAKKSRRLATRMTSLTGILGLVTSGLFFLGAQASAAWAAIGGLSGIVATVSGWLATASGLVSGFVSWLAAGSAGALAFAGAMGAAVGLFVVWILHITGVMDWVRRLGAMIGGQLPAWARDGLTALIGIFAGPLAVIGGFINGFIEGTMKGGLVQGIETGVARATQVFDTLAGAFDRTIQRAREFVVDGLSGLGDMAANSLSGAFNAVVPSQLNIPEITIGGGSVAGQDLPSATIGGGAIDLPQLQTGGMIERTGIFLGHAGERVLNTAEVSRTGESGGPSPMGGGGVTIGEISVEFGDQTLDLTNLTEADKQEIARLVAEETGREVESTIGGGL